MSGGAWNYAYYRIREVADCFPDFEIKDLLNDLADLTHDAEWYESGDYNEEQYLESLKSFKNKWFDGNREMRLRGYIDEALERTRIELYNMVGESINKKR